MSKKYYAVHRGRQPGVYFLWEDCKKQVRDYQDNVYKCFSSIVCAELFVKKGPHKFKNALRKLFNTSKKELWVSSGSEVEDCSYDDDLSDGNDEREPYICGRQKMMKKDEAYYHSEDDKEEEEVKVCRFYLRGNCKFGAFCRFYHPPRGHVAVSQRGGVGDGDGTTEKQQNAASPSNHSVKINVSHQDSNNNKNSSTTTSSVISPPPAVAIGVNNNVNRPICRFWKQGNCRFGSSCRFYHAPSCSDPPIRIENSPLQKENSSNFNHYRCIDMYGSDSDSGEDMYGGSCYGFNSGDVNTLLSYGVKPWDDDADDLLDFLHEM